MATPGRLQNLGQECPSYDSNLPDDASDVIGKSVGISLHAEFGWDDCFEQSIANRESLVLAKATPSNRMRAKRQ